MMSHPVGLVRMDRERFEFSVNALSKKGKSIRAVAAELGVNRGRVARTLRAIQLRRSLQPGRLVGRRLEMSTLTTALDEASAGHGQLVMLVGEPGIGKTRTSQEIADIAEERGAQVLWGRCYEGQGAPPYWPWIQIIRSYIHGHVPEQVRSAMAMGAPDIAEIVPEVKDQFPDLDSPPQSEPLQARFRLFDSITSFLKNASADRPLVLPLDNLHWADRSSLLLLEFLSQELADARILVIGTYRGEELTREHPLLLTLGELAKHPNFQRVNLRGLAHADIRELIELVSGTEPSEEHVKVVFNKTEGNPFFATEIVRMLAQEGTLTREAVEGQEDLGLRVPEGVKEAIGRRLRPLSGDCVQVMTVASVVGREFEMTLMKRLLPQLPSEQLLEALEEALSVGIIEEIPDATGRYQFTHVLIQETLSQEFSAARRARLHEEIGEALEALYADDVEAHADELAYHFSEADTMVGSQNVVGYSLLAGEHALATYAWEEALNYFQRGLAVKTGPDMDADRAALMFGLGRSQSATLERHRLHEIAGTVRPAFDYYVAAGDVPRALAIAEYPFFSEVGIGNDLIFMDALKLVSPDSHQAGRLLVRFGSVLGSDTANFESFIEAFGKALIIARRENDTALEIRATARMAEVHWMMCLNPRESLENSLRTIELDRQARQGQLFHLGHWWATVALIGLGDLGAARPHAVAHLAITENRGDRFSTAQGFHANAVVAQLQGNWEAARDFSDRGLAIAQQDGRLVSNRTALEYELGDFGHGDAYLERLVETMRLSPPEASLEYSITPLRIGVVSRITGRTHLFDIAEEAAKTALSFQSPISLFTHMAGIALALIAVERDDVEAATEQYDALKSLRVGMTPLTLICGHRVLGLLAQTMGRRDDAIAHFEDSLDFCRKAAALPELAWTCYDYAGVLLQRDESADHARAKSLADQALATSTELHMLPLMEKTVELQEKMRPRPADKPGVPASLTERELEVLRLVASGKSNAEIAGQLVLSTRTVERHISNIYTKTGSSGRANATAFAFTHGLMSPR